MSVTPPFLLPDGTQEWWSNQGLHRVDGPAVERPDGTQEWWQDGQRHREDGPAYHTPEGASSWWREGRLHRPDGPAVERADGFRAWYLNGKLHREDGPAVEYPDGTRLFYRFDLLHRKDGPAVVRPESLQESWHQGSQEWWQDGQRHRDDGPAVLRPDGYRAWYRHSRLHREGGPAVEHPDGRTEWFEDGVLTEEGRRPNAETDSDVVAYYEMGNEELRLHGSGYPSLEFLRARSTLLRELPSAPARVADIGGGPGIYSSWLAQLGYQVQLIEAVPEHVRQAQLRAEHGAGFDAQVGDARNLHLPDASVDAVVMFGPLYHLQSAEDRGAALREAARVLRPGGVLIASSINRHIALLHGMLSSWIEQPSYRAAMERGGGVLQGTHHPDSPRAEWFETAYGHLPAELAAEVSGAGFSDVQVTGKEGPGWMLDDRGAERIRHADRQETLMWIAREADRHPELAVMSSHLLVIARR